MVKFAESFSSGRLEELQKEDIEHFINRLVVQYKVSQSYKKQLKVSLKLCFNDLLRKNYDLFYLYPFINTFLAFETAPESRSGKEPLPTPTPKER
jgi:hypothetical protein